jgi:hypothetical protein
MRYAMILLMVFLMSCRIRQQNEVHTTTDPHVTHIQLPPGQKVSFVHLVSSNVSVETRKAYPDEQSETVEMKFYDISGRCYLKYIIQEQSVQK